MVYAILGETASGKTDAALTLCRKAGLPLLSADAFSVYEGFDIGSDKPTREELCGIETHFIDSMPWGKAMTAYSFQREGRRIVEGWREKRRDGVVVGGTFLYVKSLLFPYRFPPEAPPSQGDSPSLSTMVEELRRIDPDGLPLVDLSNPRRVQRALDMARAGQRKEDVVKGYTNTPLFPTVFLRIKTDRSDLKKRIVQRVERQIQKGLFEEERRLVEKNPSFASSFQGIGFKEIYEGEREGWTRERIVERIVLDTVRYAKRQTTFLRHQFPYVVEVEGKDIPSLVAEDIRRRKGKESLEIPLVYKGRDIEKNLASLYEKGIRQCGISGEEDESLLRAFPLLQAVWVSKENSGDRRHPKFTSRIGFPPEEAKEFGKDDLLE